MISFHELNISVSERDIEFYRNKYPNSPGAKLSNKELLDQIRLNLSRQVSYAVIDSLLYYEEYNDKE